MKQLIFTFFISLLFILFFNLPLNANNIDKQIEAIQKASVEERFKLMNAFKKEIVQMQEKERIQAISKLRSITQSKHANKAFKKLNTHTRIRQAKEYTKASEETGSNMDQEDNTENSTDDAVENGTEEQVEHQTEDSVENQTEEHVENEHEDHIENETEEHIENETEEHNEDEHDED